MPFIIAIRPEFCCFMGRERERAAHPKNCFVGRTQFAWRENCPFRRIRASRLLSKPDQGAQRC